MNLFRLLIFAALIWIVLNLWRNHQQRLQQTRKRSQDEPQVGDMVRCAVCQTHIPKREALSHKGHYYCCQEHLQQGEK